MTVAKMVVTKVIRGVFAPKNPIEVMIGFFDKEGALQGSQLLPASLFPSEVQEGQEVVFQLKPPTLHAHSASSTM